MNDDPPNNLSHRSTTALLRRALSLSLSLLPLFLSLSLLLFSFHTLLQYAVVSLSSFLHSDPSLHLLLSHLNPNNPNPNPNPNNPNNNPSDPNSFLSRRRNNRPFLHLSRLASLHDDFFDDTLRVDSPFPRVNSSYLRISSFPQKSGFSGASISDHGIRFPEIVRYRISFQIDEKNNPDDNPNPNLDKNVVDDLKFLVVGGLELGRRDAAALFFLVSVLSAAYGWVILGFVITYSWVLGIVFIAVVNDLLGRYMSFTETLWNGSNLGVKRLSGFILMRWAVRDALTQILGLWFFGEIEDQYSFFKLFLRLKLMPFSVSSPWVGGYEKEVSGFLFAWFLVDTIVAFVFAVDSWVTIVSTRRGGREIVKEGLYLLGVMIHQSIQLKCLELILCGAFSRWVLAKLFGKNFAVLLQSVIEVYFMVAWLVFYFAARQKDASLNGRRFGRRELEGLIDGLR